VEGNDPAKRAILDWQHVKRVEVEAASPQRVLRQSFVAGRAKLVVTYAIESQHAERLLSGPTG
jgi:hypothetical protein